MKQILSIIALFFVVSCNGQGIDKSQISTNAILITSYNTLTIPTQSTDYLLNANWGSYSINTYEVDCVNFTGTNILIGGSNPKLGGIYTFIFKNTGSKNLVFSSSFINFSNFSDIGTLAITENTRIQLVYNGSKYIRLY